MNPESLPLCFVQMERDLYVALESDTQKELENEAKFRAISQRVSTYDEFREMVKGAHLKAVNRSLPANRNPRGRIWNSIASRKGTEEDLVDSMNGTEWSASCNCAVNVAQLQLPTSSSQFMCWWQRCDVPSRLALMYKLGPAGLGHLFRIDIPTDLLGEIFQALLAFSPTIEDIASVVALLEALTEVKRFTLGLQFLNAAERSTCQQLLQKLMASLVHKEQDLAELCITEWTIQELARKYRVHLISS